MSFIIDNILSGFGDLKNLYDKKILLIGGYLSFVKVGEEIMPVVHALKELVFNPNNMYSKTVVTCERYSAYSASCVKDFDYAGDMEELSEVLRNEGKFDVVFVFEGMEKVINPVKAFKVLRDLCVVGGKIFLFCRTPVELGTKYWLDWYEDNWRYEPADISNFFSSDINFSATAPENMETFLINFQKSSEKFFPDENFKFFNCRVK